MEGSDFLISLKFNRHFLGFRMIIGKKGENELNSIITCNAQLVARNLQRVTRIQHHATRNAYSTTSDTANFRDEAHA
jgi:hypothetical protein